MTRPSPSRKRPSQTMMRGIFEVGFSKRVRPQLSGFGDMSAITNIIDFGMMGVHMRRTRLPSEYTPIVNFSIKLLDFPIPTWSNGG